MDPITPLLMMWLASKAAAPSRPPSAAPRWPTPSSPPPLPAFYPQTPPAPPAPSADPGGTSTPLAALHTNPPSPPPASAKPKPKKAAAKPRIPTITPGLLQSTQTVKTLQKILNQRGANLKPDGLFGPKTAAAWSSIAKQKFLPSAITRVGPQTARVVTQTFDALSIPAIP